MKKKMKGQVYLNAESFSVSPRKREKQKLRKQVWWHGRVSAIPEMGSQLCFFESIWLWLRLYPTATSFAWLCSTAVESIGVQKNPQSIYCPPRGNFLAGNYFLSFTASGFFIFPSLSNFFLFIYLDINCNFVNKSIHTIFDQSRLDWLMCLFSISS